MKKLMLILVAVAPSLFASGTLTPTAGNKAPIQIREHVVNVVIDNGFARTEVNQVFFNPNPTDVEAIYTFPVPKSASLAGLTIRNGDRTLEGEVVEADKAKKVYEEERDSGNDAGLGECSCTKEKKDIEYSSYKFSIANVRAQSETRIQFVYYQPLKIESAVGRYVYPMDEGGTDEAAKDFWSRNSHVEQHFTVNVELRSGWPVDEVRTPGVEDAAKVDKIDAGHYKVTVDREAADLNHDFVFYYRLAENLPGRVELMTYKPSANAPGTFMLTVTPGEDLAPIGQPLSASAGGMTYNETVTVNSTAGADYVFVLDISGSMQSKLPTLAKGVQQTLTHFKPGDRFRIFTFNQHANELTPGFVPANAETVAQWSDKVQQLRSWGGTNVYEGLKAGLDAVQADRATSVLFVTDGVANEGIVDPKAFRALLKKYDVRVFGFLMGNNANWPLMQLIAETSGGFYDAVSNDDDIVGAILLAKSKIISEAMHDAKLTIDGVATSDRTDDVVTKIYRGQQLVIFGRYDKGGPSNVKLAAKMTGQDATYTTAFDFPEVSTDYPELERMWAMSRIENAITKETAGLMPPEESESTIRDLGLKYQLVTDYTSMIVLSDEDFAKHGIDRTNKERVDSERKAQAARVTAPPSTFRVDANRPMFTGPAHTTRGGGAIDPITALIIFAGICVILAVRKK